MIRVVLVDDQTLVRQGLRSLLELTDDISVIAEAADGEAAIPCILDAKPDVLLIDVRMPKRSGVEVIAELQARSLLPPTIILTTFDEDDILLDSLRAGAKGYLLKDVSFDQLTLAIRTVAAGQTLIQPSLTERVVRTLSKNKTEFPSIEKPEPLTKREIEILRLLAGGYKNREIAHVLGAAEGTVKNHISSILNKLGVKDRTRAILRAVELGLI